MRGTTDTSTPSSWQRWISRLTRASATEENATIRFLTPVRSTASSRSSIVPSTGTSRPPTSATERGSSSRKPTGHEPVLGVALEPPRHLRADDAGAHDQHGLADQPLRARPALGERSAAVRPRPTPTSAQNQARTQSVWSGTSPLMKQAEHRDGHRADRHAADDRHDPVEDQRAQPRAVEAAQVEEQHHERRQRAAAAPAPEARGASPARRRARSRPRRRASRSRRSGARRPSRGPRAPTAAGRGSRRRQRPRRGRVVSQLAPAAGACVDRLLGDSRSIHGWRVDSP